MKTKQDKNGATTSYEYDCHGRLKKKSVGSLSVAYMYDGNGNQLTMTDSTGTTERIYDELNRVTTKIVPKFGTTIYTYDITAGVDAVFTAQQSKDPKGNITTKVFDKAGRIKYVYDGAVTSTSKTEYNYYDNGNRRNVIYPNKFKEEYEYYKNNLIWTLKNYLYAKDIDANILMDAYTYTYDGANNQITKKDVIKFHGLGTTNYTYDVLNRLKTVEEPNARTTSYKYDKAGNRKSEIVTFNGETTTTTYDYSKDNRLESSTKKQDEEVTEEETYGYDYNGNMNYKSKSTIQSYDVSEGETIGLYAETMGNSEVTVNGYDGFNQLIKTQIGDMNITYAYNGEGYRVEKKVNNSTTRYLYEYDKVVLEMDATGKQTGRNIYGTNLLMRKAGNDTLYYMYNGHADVTALIDATTGVVRGSYYYDAFGNVLEQKYYTASGAATSEKINNSITYAGYQYDDETGLYYLNARMYDPKVARFLQEDTYRGSASDPLSLNLYTYCHNEPIMYFDPTGHTSQYLRRGIQGEDVKLLQQHLSNLGYSLGTYGADGKFGGDTETAVKEFQKDYDIDVDGVVGNQTWSVLEKANVLLVAQSKTDIPESIIAQQINIAKNTTPGPAIFKRTYDVEAYEKPSAKTGVGMDIQVNESFTSNTDVQNVESDIIGNVLGLSGAVSFYGNLASAIAINTNDFSIGANTTSKIGNIVTDLVFPSTTEIGDAERLLNKAAKIGGQGVKLKNGKFVSIKTVNTASKVGKVGKALGVIGTIITPFTEIGNSTDLYKEDLEWMAENNPDNYNKAMVLAVIGSPLEACSIFSFSRSLANTVPALVQIMPGEDPEWTDTWTENVNKYDNAKILGDRLSSLFTN